MTDLPVAKEMWVPVTQAAGTADPHNPRLLAGQAI